MLIVKESIVSDDIAECRFCCDLSQCKGECCIEGDYGAPLLEEEIPILQRILPQVQPYMTPEGLQAVAEQGVSTLDNAAEPCTPLVNNRECAYVAWAPDGTALCAIEQAYRDGLDLDHLPDAFRYLLNSPRTVLSPHVAGWTVLLEQCSNPQHR